MLKLTDIDHEDLEYLLAEIESSFNIRFEYDELSLKMTFGEVCDAIIQKIQLDHSDDCTTQQMFYKLRTSIVDTLGYDHNKINPDTLLNEFLPRKDRILFTKQLENNLGIELSLLGPPNFIIYTLLVVLFTSFIGFFFSWKIGITGFTLSIIGFMLSAKFGKELNFKTVRELVKSITMNKYLKSRRNPETINKNEIEDNLINLFSYRFDLDKSSLSRDATFL